VLNPDENITSYFGMGYFYSGQIIPVNEFIGSGRSVSLEESFKLGFNQPPGKAIKLEFEVRVILKSGKVFLIENQVLHLR
jgi:hypothetical protein